MNAIDALRYVDFEWAVHFNEVWSVPAVDAPELHGRLRAEFARKLDAMEGKSGHASPLGWVIAGAGGTGKTHLLGAFRREATRRGVPFIMVDMTDVHNFWECVLQGYVDSMQAEIDGGPPQFKRAIANIIERLGPKNPAAEILRTLSTHKSRDQRDDANRVLSALNGLWPREAMKHQNVIRALVCINSDDFTIANIGRTWLQGVELEDDQRRELGFTVPGERPSKIVEALSWLLSLGGPAVLAFDQLDASVEQFHNQKHGGGDDDERSNTARSILAGLGGGLGALRDITRNTLAVVSCLESTWAHLRGVVLGTAIDRFEAPFRLRIEHDEAIARTVVAGRLAAAYRAAGFTPAYPTHPFRPEAFAELKGASPREILKLCGAHVQACLYADNVAELSSFVRGDAPKPSAPPLQSDLDRLDAEFQRLKAEADPAWALEEKHDDDRLAPLILTGLSCLVAERASDPNVSATIDAELTGGAKTRPLHARLRLIHHDLNEREEHFCVRAIQWTNDRAFQSRLKAALTQSGIDRNLNFRRLTVIRSLPNPNGPVSQRLIADFQRHGGAFARPTTDDLRVLIALDQMKARKDIAFKKWLEARRPASALGLIQTIVGDNPLFSPTPAIQEPSRRAEGVSPPSGENSPRKETEIKPHTDSPKVVSTSEIPLGRKIQAGKPTDPIGLPIRLLDKHALILAGSGSGKTVLLKRLIEQAAIAGVPSIVIDGANDLAALDERWATPPDPWTDDDQRDADAYHVPGRVVVWTPGKESGNPISLEPAPDLAPLVHDGEELDAAVSMIVETLSPRVARGNARSNPHKLAILQKSLKYLASHGGGRLKELVDLLSDLPPEAGANIGGEAKLAAAMADDLRAAMVLDPLLRSTGPPLDPAVLLGSNRPENAPARVSVISLAGLPGLEAQRNFLNQLTIALFSWIKKTPDFGDRPLRGLLVIDEARDFAPSQKFSACGGGLLRLTTQARKYRLGLLFATQNPKDIENKIVGNCSSHFYGKMNSPATISATQELIRQKGGSGNDISKLAAGWFYFHNADLGLTQPTKILASHCLSNHPKNPLDEETIVAKAAASRSTTQPGPA